MSELAIFSLLVTLIFTEITQLSPGGIVVPLYFALFADDPVKMAATVISALITVGLMKLLGAVTILYGRRRFALYIIIGLLLKLLFSYIYFGDSYLFYNLSMTIGYLVPGILGSQMEKQGCVKTLAALAVVVLIIKTAQVIFA